MFWFFPSIIRYIYYQKCLGKRWRWYVRRQMFSVTGWNQRGGGAAKRCVKNLQLRRAVAVRWIFLLYLCKNIVLKMSQKSGLLNHKNFHLTAPLKQAVFVFPETHNNLKTTYFCSEKPPAKEFYSRMVINCFWSPNPRAWCRQVYGSLRAACVFIHCKFVESGLCDNNVDHNPFMRCRKVAFYWNTSVWEFLIVSA